MARTHARRQTIAYSEEGIAHTGTGQAFAGRRMLIAMMAEIGISGDVISRILNHTPPGPQATKIYNRFDYEPQKREALEGWEDHLMSIFRAKSDQERAKIEPGKAHGRWAVRQRSE